MHTVAGTPAIEAEMSIEDHELLLRHLEQKKPKKVLELGVSAGGTTRLLLDNISSDATLYSVDIATQFYKNPSLQTGHLAKKHYDPNIHAKWVTLFGKDISFCIEEIGENIDFIVLDTTHTLPGEVLSFLAVLPYVADNAVLIVHDIALHIQYKRDKNRLQSKYPLEGYCNTLLFYALSCTIKEHSLADIPNCGAAVLNKKLLMGNMFPIISTLYVEWGYLPPADLLMKTREIMQKHYSKKDILLFDEAILYNLEKKGVQVSQNK